MGFIPHNLGNFYAENYNNFLGTLFSKTLNNSITPDVITIYKPLSNAPEITVTIGETEYNSLYFREYLNTKDKYSVFLSINAPVIEIKSELSASNRRLLMFKDSYANCLIPFLTNNFNEITVIDLRFVNQPYSEFLNIEDYDSVLFLYNVMTFSECISIVKLNAGR
jgi:hypothetical protein